MIVSHAVTLSYMPHQVVDVSCLYRQLEVLRNNDDGNEKGSLLWLMDHTKTPFGGRLLRSWVAHPLTDRQLINERLDAVEEMVAAGAMEQGGMHRFTHVRAFYVSGTIIVLYTSPH